MNEERCYCGGDKVEPERHANCWRAYVAGLRRAMVICQTSLPRNVETFDVKNIRAELEAALRGGRG